MACKMALLFAVALMVIAPTARTIQQIPSANRKGGPLPLPLVPDIINSIGRVVTCVTSLTSLAGGNIIFPLVCALGELINIIELILGGAPSADDVCLATDYTAGETTKPNEDYGEEGGDTFTDLEQDRPLNVIVIPDTAVGASDVDTLFYVLTDQTSTEGDTIIIFSVGRTGGAQPMHFPFARSGDLGGTGECQLTGTNMVGPYEVVNEGFDDSCTMTMKIVEAGDDCRSFIINLCDINGECSVLSDIFPEENNCAAFSKNLDFPRSPCCTALSAQIRTVLPVQASICTPVDFGGMPLLQVTDEEGAAQSIVDFPNLVFTYCTSLDVTTQVSTPGSCSRNTFTPY